LIGEGQQRHSQLLNRSFTIAAEEVTVEQFLSFRKTHRNDNEVAADKERPANMVNWYDAVAYCNWLSEQEGHPKDQWCYEPNEKGAWRAWLVRAERDRVLKQALKVDAVWGRRSMPHKRFR
jgi:formylglycine-generating enzyme required for sulfatase activity